MANVDTGNTGRSQANATPCTTPAAIRSPVNEPGPRPKAIASSCDRVIPASEIRVSDIFNCLGEDYSLIDCVLNKNACNRKEFCHNIKFWVKLHEHIDKVFNSVTLLNIIDGEFNI